MGCVLKEVVVVLISLCGGRGPGDVVRRRVKIERAFDDTKSLRGR